MKKAFSVIFAFAVIFTMLPVQSFAAKENTVDFYGNSISADIRALKITRSQYLSDGSKSICYIPSDTPLDCELLAEKFPRLYVLELNDGNIENTEALSKLKNLAVLKITCRDDRGESLGDISFLESMTNLRNLYIYNEQRVDIDIAPLAKLTNLTELYLNFPKSQEYYDNRTFDISPLGKLTKIKKLTLQFETDDISPLKNMPELEYLRLYGANIPDAKQLSELKNLKTLKLLNCRFAPFEEERTGESINGVGELENLEDLELFFRTVPSSKQTDLDFVSKLTKLKALTIIGSSMTNCDFLKNLTSLEKLKLDSCGVSDISGLTGLTELKILDIYDNKITDFAALENLTKLERLYIPKNRYYNDSSKITVKNVKALSKLTELKELTIYGNKINDFSFLKSLDKLEKLYIEDTGWDNDTISTSIVEEFTEDHPDCIVGK